MSGAEEGKARNGCELTVLGNKPQRRMIAKCVQPTTPRSPRRPLLAFLRLFNGTAKTQKKRKKTRKVGSRSLFLAD